MEDPVAPPPAGATSSGPPPSRPMRMPGIPLGRVAGVPIFLTASWLILAVLVTVTYGGYVAVRRPDLTTTVAYLIGFGLVICLLISVLLHELGHALTARHFGIGVRGITLEMLGGYTEMDRDSPSPRIEALVSLVGPAVSLLLGLVAAGLAVLLPDGGIAHELAFQMAFSNLVVAVFNVLPGLPLDGGRALRAGVWAISHDRHLGDRVAGWTGRVVAVGSFLAALALYMGHIISWIGLIIIVLVAVTLWTGATQSIRFGKIGVRLPLLNAGRLARPLFPVPTGTPLAEAQRRFSEANRLAPPAPAPRPVLAVVNSAGQLLGVVSEEAVAAVPSERRPWVSIDTVARSIDRERVLPAELSGMDVIQAVQAHPGTEYVVTVGEDVIGVLRVADVMRVLEARGPQR